MPINVYTGLMRSGKTYEVVSEVILPAIRGGRRIVTNVDGISEENIIAYLKLSFPDDDFSAYGSVLHVTNEQVFKDDFFPYFDDKKSSITNTTVQPGDLVCIDEAWRFWPSTGSKIHKNHHSFFLEHGHFTNEITKVSCDLVLMIQDMGTLNRHLKAVIAFNFRTHKKVSLGLNNTYSITMFEGHTQTSKAQIGNWVRSYKKEIFPLYSSFKGGAEGVIVNADKRQNIFTNKWLFIKYGAVFVGMFGSIGYLYNHFSPSNPQNTVKTDLNPKEATTQAPTLVKGSKPLFNDTWRISGYVSVRGQNSVVLVNQSGTVRLASPSEFAGVGSYQLGDIDGSKVSFYSGSSTKSPSLDLTK